MLNLRCIHKTRKQLLAASGPILPCLQSCGCPRARIWDVLFVNCYSQTVRLTVRKSNWTEGTIARGTVLLKKNYLDEDYAQDPLEIRGSDGKLLGEILPSAFSQAFAYGDKLKVLPLTAQNYRVPRK